MFKLKIRTRLLLTIIILLLITLGSTDFLWFGLVRPILTDRLAAIQNQLGTLAVVKMEEFLKAKIRTLILHSQTASFLTQDRAPQKFELATLFFQDQDIIKLTVLDNTGQEVMELTRTQETPKEQLEDKSRSPSFLAVTFRYGKEYISNVTFTSQNEPQITVAVPITVPKSPQRLTELTTAGPGEERWPGEILGVLEAQVSLENLFDEIADLGGEAAGSLYVVDTKGRVIAHQNAKLVSTRADFTRFNPVEEHVETLGKSPITHEEENVIAQYFNENTVSVFASHVHVPTTGWGVVIQQPTSVALAEFNRVTQFALLLVLSGIFISIPIVYVLSRQLAKPILQLVKGVHIFGEGHLGHQIEIDTGDEIQELADAFNDMAVKLKGSVDELEKDRNIIAAERNKLAVVVSGIEDGVIALDQKFNIVLMNKAAEKITGWWTDDASGKHADRVLHVYDDQENNLVSSSVYCPPGPRKDKDAIRYFHPGLRLITKTGVVKYVGLASASIKEGVAVNLSCIVTFHDVTEEKELERMKLDFVSMAAHELRTPITIIRGYLSFLQQEEALRKLNQEERKFLSRAMLSAVNLNGLVENLLNVARIEQGALGIHRQPVRLEEITSKVVHELQQLAESKGLKLLFSPPSRMLPQVQGDPLRIEEVLRNLLSNAINFTQEGEVEVSQRKRDNFILTAVRDTGQGIPDVAIPHLFTKFFRVQGVLETGSKGTGLGLYISKNIIDAHGGKIWVESKLGVGTTVYFTLPIAHQRSEKQPT